MEQMLQMVGHHHYLLLDLLQFLVLEVALVEIIVVAQLLEVHVELVIMVVRVAVVVTKIALVVLEFLAKEIAAELLDHNGLAVAAVEKMPLVGAQLTIPKAGVVGMGWHHQLLVHL
jgi:hypothetical protein